MKKQIMRKVMWMLMAFLLGATSLTGCKKEQVEEEKKPQQEEKAAYVQLLGFDSYEEFTGARISIGNMLGKMDINTDKQYITQGKGSLEVNPQGNYDKVRKHPYFKLDFLNTTCATCDFTEFKNVSFDVYNPSEEMKQVRVSLSVGKDDGVYTTTIKSIYDLEPKSWTTCVYDISEMAGFTYYDFANVRYMTVEFMDHKENRDDVVEPLYIDNLVGNYYAEGESAANVTYDFWEGITFEESTDQYLVFGDDVEVNKVELSRADYEKEGISVSESLGKYGMKADATESIWPKFSIRLGEKVPADTAFSFMAYVKVDASEDDIFSFESYSVFGGNNVPNEITISDTVFNDWVEVTVRTSIETDVISGFFNFDDFSDPVTGHTRFGEKEVVIYLDNMKLGPYVDPMSLVPSNIDWIKGLTFEKDGEQYLITNENDGDNQKMKLSRVAWAEEGMKVNSEFGQYGMRGKVKGAAYPEMTINYRKTMPADTIITFKAYIKTDTSKTYYKADGSKVTTVKTESFGNVDLSGEIPLNEWLDIKIRLSKAQDTTRMFFNFDNGKDTTCFGSDEVLIYFDNIRVEVPIQPEGDFYEGIGFEVPGNAALFTPQNKQGEEYMDAMIERVTYSQAGITAPKNGGEHALKISHKSFFWPRFRMNFGTTLPAGTKITFMAYGKVHGDTLYDISLFEYTAGGEATAQFSLEKWTELSIILKEDAEYLDLFWNYDRAGGLKEGTSAEVYIDNVKATEPAEAPVLDITQGVDFEDAGEEAYITGKGAWNDMATQRVAYSEIAGIPALDGGDQYLMKLTNENSLWPALQINFGKELEAGTEVSFKVYGKINGDTTNNKTKFEFIKENGQGMGIDAGNEFNLGEWTLVTMSIPEKTDKIYLCWNMDHAGGVVEGTETGELYIDNLIATAPVVEPPVVGPVLDITQGVDFEDAGEEAYITGKGAWNDVAAERVTYSSLSGIPALDGGDQYLMKLTNENSLWPALQINFGKELEAGTEVSFKVYGKINGDTTRNKTKFEFIKESGQGMGLDAGSEFNLGEWTLVTMSIPETTDKIYLCWNMDHAGGVVEGTETGELYIDNLIATAPSAAPVGDIEEGYGFEVEGNELYFAGQNIEGSEWMDATIERVDYASEGITAPVDGGSYALKLSHDSFYWPKFRINFGKELPAGTKITFQALGKITSGEFLYNQSIFEYSAGGEATAQFTHDGWKELTITLETATSYLDLFWNYDRATITSSSASGEVYIDNIKATEPSAAPVLDITQGTGFENAGEEAYITGKGAWNDVAAQRVTYSEVTGIPALDGGDQYLMKLTNENSLWPALQINFGKELEAGTEVSFMVYGKINGDTTNNKTKFEFINESGKSIGDAGSEFNLGEWTLVTMSIPEKADKIYLCWNMDHAGGVVEGTETGELYIDNLIAAAPVVEPPVVEPPVVGPVLDITQGVDFEDAGEEAYITGKGAWNDVAAQRVTYSEVSGIPALDGGDQYLMKLTNENSLWPALQINFGKELEAGTEVSFKVYGKINGDTTRNKTKFEFLNESGKSIGDAGNEFNLGEWTLVTMSIPEKADKIYLCWNMDHAGGVDEGTETGELYIDNLIATAPSVAPVGDIEEGYGFEVEGNERYFAGQNIEGSEWMDATIERVDYASEGITAPVDGGSYALKLSHDSFYWPKFRINFGKELPAGTKITFQALGKITSGEFLYNQSIFEYSAGGEATAQFTHDGWKELTITLKTATSYLDLFWNYDRASITSSSASGEVYIDNIKATDPSAAPGLDITQGVDFEDAGEEAYITGKGAWNDVAAERVTYSSLSGIPALDGGNQYLMKLTNSNSLWPALQINFGKELEAGTEVSFMVYGKINGDTTRNKTKFEFIKESGQGMGLDAGSEFNLGEWTTVTMTIPEKADKIYLCWNMDHAGGVVEGTETGELYIDNLIATVSTEDITQGVDFEDAGEEAYITGKGAWNDVAAERVTYSSLSGIPALDGGDQYLMKLTNENSLWPALQINFGKELEAGTEVTFKVYGKINGDTTNNKTKFEFINESGKSIGNAGGEFNLGEWTTVTMTIPEKADKIYLCWNMDHAGGVVEGTETGELYIDNLIAAAP